MDFHPAIFENITGEVIRAAALHMQGAAEPSGLDALSWRRLVHSMDSYFLNGSKTYVLTKPHQVEAAKEVFKDTGIVISTERKRYLGGALGTSSFIRQYVERKPWNGSLLMKIQNITGEVIRAAALHTQGAAGPSRLDALSWRRLCTTFGQKSNDLCAALAAVALRISTTYIDPSALQAFTSCRVIPYDKYPGVRPIGIGEFVQESLERQS